MSDNSHGSFMAGLARGVITIDTSQPQQVPGIMQGVSQAAAKSMGAIDAAAQQNVASLAAARAAVQAYAQGAQGSLAQARASMQQFADGASGSLSQARVAVQKFAQGSTQDFSNLINFARQLAGAFGISFGVAGVVQLGKMAIAASETATAYDRQRVAALTLAGSQDQLNAKLEAYDRATGGVVDKATSLANVTKLMAVGFGDSVPEIEKFATAIRGISIAMGATQDTVTQNLILELFTQRGARLDQLGLSYDLVKQRADELQAADESLTSKQAYQNAVLEQAEERFGKLATSGAGAATGLEKAKKSTTDLGLAIGTILGPTVNAVGSMFASQLDLWAKGLEGAIKLVKDLEIAVGLLPQEISLSMKMRTGIGSNMRQAPAAMERTPVEGENAAKLDWAKGIIQLNADTNEQLQKQNSDYQRQRADSERQFQTSTTRANEDFMLARARQEQDLAETIARIHSDAAHREERQAADLARSIAQATTDSAEKVADAREDANKRLVELDEDYEKARVKRASDLTDKLLDAAGNLDAKQVYQLQRDAAKQQEEAEDAHKDARDQIGEQLDEKLDDEAKSLAKSIAQQQDAYSRQLADGREADAQRITDMEADAVKRRAQEDYDFGLRMKRAQEDHDAQMAEMDRAQGERITQIQTHAAEERDQLDDEHKRALDELMNHHSEWNKELVKADDAALEEFDRLTHPIRVWLKQPTGFLPTPTGLPIGASANAVPGMSGSATGGSTYNSRSHSGDINLTIQGSGLSESQLQRAIYAALHDVFGDTP